MALCSGKCPRDFTVHSATHTSVKSQRLNPEQLYPALAVLRDLRVGYILADSQLRGTAPYSSVAPAF